MAVLVLGATGKTGRRVVYSDLAVPGAPEAIGALAERALEAGCRRLVLLSGRGEEEAQRAERVLAESGAEWTVLRCSWFMQNFSEGTSPTRSPPASSPCPRGTGARPSWTPTTSPTWRWPPSPRTATRAASTS